MASASFVNPSPLDYTEPVFSVPTCRLTVPALQKAIGQEMEQISLLLDERLPEDLVDLPQLQDEQVASLIPLLLSIAPYAYQSQQPELFALLGARCLRLSLAHGQAGFTPDVYAMYSAVYAAMTGDRQGGAAWSNLSLQLQPEVKGASFARCAFINVWFHNHWDGDAGGRNCTCTSRRRCRIGERRNSLRMFQSFSMRGSARRRRSSH